MPIESVMHPTIASSVAFFFCFQFFPASGSISASRLFTPDSQSTGASASVLPMNIQDWFLSFRIDKGPSKGQSYGFSSGHVWMWELNYKESWLRKNWCFWTVLLEKTLESPLDCQEVQPVHPKGNQSWMFIGRTDAEAKTPILWLPDVKNWLIWKDSAAGKDWRWKEKGMTEDEMVGWHYRLNGHTFE